MKSSLINLYQGYLSLFKYIFTGRNDGRFLQLNFSLPFILMVLILVGLARNLLSVIFGIKLIFAEPLFTNGVFSGFYSMRPDIVFVMMVAGLFFCFFGALALILFLRIFKEQRDDKKVLALCFHLQILHVLVPFLDIINLKFNIPYYFQIFPEPQSFIHAFIFHLLVMTVGIVAVWTLSGVAVMRFLKDICRVSVPKIFLISFLTFNLLFWPIYIIYPLSNYLFNYFLPVEGTEGYDNFMGGAYHLFYGYAVFFLVLAVSGIIYFRKLFFESNN